MTGARRAGGMERRELAALLALLATPGVSQRRALELLQQHGDARAAFDGLALSCGERVAAGARGADVRRRVLRSLAAVERYGIRVLAFGDPDYPPRLAELLGDAAPPALFAHGDTALLARPGVAVVGCRGATEYGLDVGARIGAAVARAGGCVISGLARGVDAAAHEASLDAGGTTIAVLGCGVDVYYPRQNTSLQDRIAAAGLLISEFLPGEGPRRHRFPQRNRIIAALARGVVIVEAGAKSGALNTAEHAMGMGVPTWAVPNAVDRPTAEGILQLYRDGVPPFTGVADLLEDVGLVRLGDGESLETAAAPDPPTSPRHAIVWAALGSEPLHADHIAARTGVPAAEALVTLLELELDGRARHLAGGLFCRPAAARRSA